MIRSFSCRSRWAAASKRASAEPRAAPADRDRPAPERAALFVARERLLVAPERVDFAEDERVDPDRLVPERVDPDRVDDDRARPPVPELDLPEPPLLACGLLPPSRVTGPFACT